MHWKVKRQFLSRVELFNNLGKRELKVLAKLTEFETYFAGQDLCRQGERGIAAFLIVSGEVKVLNVSDGEEIEVAVLGQGEMVGELSIIDGFERVATVRAIEEVEILSITQWSMLALLKSHPKIAVSMLKVIVKRFRETAEELSRHNLKSNEKRLSMMV